MAEASARSCDRLTKEPTISSGEGMAKAGAALASVKTRIAEAVAMNECTTEVSKRASIMSPFSPFGP
jgi:hypothetical protein